MRYLILDTETTGVSNKDKAVELAWIEVDEFLTVQNEVRTLLDPMMPIDPEASAVNGIYDKDVENEPTIDEFFEIVLQGRMDGVPVVQIGHNSHFDRKFVEHKLNIQAEVCTLRLARKLWPLADNHKLTTLQGLFNLPDRGKAHGALVDCWITLDLMRLICEQFDLSLADLIEICSKPILLETVPFGKYKGTPFSELPAHYRNWIRKQDFDIDVLHSLEMLT